MKIMEKNLEFFIDIDDKLPSALVLDETRLRQILLNLVGNAVKFTEEGYIKLKAKKKYRTNDHSTIDLIISVEDSGIGIQEEELENIFDAFNQQHGQNTKRFGGTGLGLSICKKFLEIMDGQISVESVPRIGSTFGIILRNVEVSSSEIDSNEKEDFDMDLISFKDAKILVVDDVESNRELMQELLSMVNLDVLTAENGEQAIIVASEYQPDLILMDIRMPIMDGIEATKKLRTNPMTKNIPVIALTASSIQSEKEAIFNVGMKAILRKPVKIRNIIETLGDYLAYTTKEAKYGAEREQETIDTEIVNYDELLFAIENELLPLHNKLKNVILMSDINEFAVICKETGNKHSIFPLVDYSKELEKNSRNLEVDNIEKLIKRFPNIVNQIYNYKE